MKLTKYQQKCITEYTRAMRKAERLLKDAEHDMWHTDHVQPLYALSEKAREMLYLLAEEMDQAVFSAQESE